MKFLPKRKVESPILRDSCNQAIENYVYSTKDNLDQQLPNICKTNDYNLTKAQKQALKSLKNKQNLLTIKPADKNLGLVIMNTDDYITQCIRHLSNPETYRQVDSFPTDTIQKIIDDVLIAYKAHIQGYSKPLYSYLQPKTKHSRTPQFYGIPKVHKEFELLPPIRPIVAHTQSILSPTAHLIDHILQPLAQSYPDYIQNSTALILQLQDVTIPTDALLVTIDVVSLYPSIPQTECLQIIYEEMFSHRDLLLLDPNLIMRLLHLNINNNYFKFANFTFQQIQGTAMGASFSPTAANIFMSILLRNFIRTQPIQPILLKRYIDDILMIWPANMDIHNFMTTLNNYHPNIKFTYTCSQTSVDFLDVTIYKKHTALATKTYQKQQNLYQYLHYTSVHPKAVHKGLIIGECIRYVRTNTEKVDFEALLKLFTIRLLKRHYPRQFITHCISKVDFDKRQQYLQCAQPNRYIARPIFKGLPPPQYKQLKYIILQNFRQIQHLVLPPLFIPLQHKTIGQRLVRAKIAPTDEQFIDILIQLGRRTPQVQLQHTPAQLPTRKANEISIRPCRRPKCITCKYLNCSLTFRSTKTGIEYPIRHSFTCTSTNLIYLITCTKCKKQYVGLTTKQLNYRFNHHRTNIMQHKNIYISNHFNFPDHSIENLSIQVIDAVPDQSHQTLREVEKFWIVTLKTLRPNGLNYCL